MSKLGIPIGGLGALLFACAPALFSCIPANLSGAEPAEQDIAFFENRIRPVLVKHCYQCHSADAEELGGKLRLDTREVMLQGGQSGPALVAGDPESSLLVQALRYDGLEMPPDEPLPPQVASDFARWIQRGAPDPRSDEVAIADPSELDWQRLWSFLPPEPQSLPAVQAADWPRDPLDYFVLAEIEASGQQPAADADAATLIRRLYDDLIGLPPRLAEVEAFVAGHERQPHVATEKLVDELLAQPQFGERWGRHWLDVARFGESNGDDGLGRNATFPHAWRYRDYVIDAFNRDVSYDRFLTEQIAGDLLPADSAAQRNRQLVATGFLAIGSKPAKAMNKNFAMDIVDDQINAVWTAVTGLSVACARCHDHKHDPISTRDYYALAGIFDSTQTLYGLAGNEKLTAPPTELHALRSNWDPQGKHRSPASQAPAPPTLGLAMGVRDEKKPADCKIHVGGESSKLGPSVPRGIPTIYDRIPSELASHFNSHRFSIAEGQSGRLQLARWLTHPQHPQTARVMVNRIWLHLFGRGIVSTPHDFGVYGAPPSHPALLDQLAGRLVRDDWSIKRLIRSIVLSRTYQLDSLCDERLRKADPDNRLFARHSLRRLNAESLRDGILQASGTLDRRPGQGSAIDETVTLINWPPGEATDLHQASQHRSIYLCLLRHSPPAELEAFDLPDGVGVVGQREETTLPTQSLFLLNNGFVVQQARALAARLLDHVDDGEQETARRLYRRILLRDPTASETVAAIRHVQSVAALLAQQEHALPSDVQREQAWASLCQALFATNEFRYVD